MTNQQLYLAIGLPILANLMFNGFIFLALSARITDLGARMTQMEASINKRMDELKDLWRAELHRVEEVLDARLKHLEER
jgi:hypothetical protein